MITENIINRLLNGLNPGQKKCVLHESGPGLVLAGPGSGKTRVITVRAALLANSNKKVLTMSFNKAAAIEMKERAVGYSCEKILENCEFSTIHSFCYKLIRKYQVRSGKNMPSVLPEEKRVKVIGEIMQETLKVKNINFDELRSLSSYISKNSVGVHRFDMMSEKYTLWKNKNNMIDYDDMISIACELLNTDGDFANNVAVMFDYIQIDEAQDLSEKQYDLLKLLRTNNIVLVADDDQSIYGFRGAKPDLLFDFEHTYHNCKRFLLEENYRSDYVITATSSEFIKSNKTRFKKNFYTRNIRAGKIILKRFSDTEKQAAETSKLIFSNYQAGKSVCVLYRNNASLICPLVSLIMDINRRKKDFPDIVIKGELPDAKEIDLIFDIFCDVNDDIYTAELKIFNYGFSGKRRFHINCLKSAAMILGNAFHTELSLQKLYEQIKNVGLVKSEKNAGKIFFSTIHSAKGLEFDTVIVIDMVEGELPSVDSKDESAIEEERRLAYVAITRAKSKVYMFYPEKNFKTIQKKSRFLDETQKAMQTYY